MKFSVNVVLNDKANKSGLYPIFVRYTYQRRHLKIAVGHQCREAEFDAAAGYIRAGVKEAPLTNIAIVNITGRLHEIVGELEAHNIEPFVEVVKDRFFNSTPPDNGSGERHYYAGHNRKPSPPSLFVLEHRKFKLGVIEEYQRTQQIVQQVLKPERKPRTKPATSKIEKPGISFEAVFEKFIADSKSGVRSTGKGMRIKPDTIKKYKSCLTMIRKYSEENQYPLKWSNITKEFYNGFCNWLWENGSADGNVGAYIKNLKTMLLWAFDSKLIKEKKFDKDWITWREDRVESLVLYTPEIKIMLNLPDLSDRLQRTADIFAVGVFTCFRVSHLLSLTENDLIIEGGEWSVRTRETKGNKPVEVKLNSIAVGIIQKYRHQYQTLLPEITDVNFNKNLKLLGRVLQDYIVENNINLPGMNNWTRKFSKTVMERGEPVTSLYDHAELLTSHCMRRSGITFLASIGMSREEICTISGHSLDSREVTKYIKLNQQLVLDKARRMQEDAFQKAA